MHIGIDYGSKLAGTTVIAFAEGGKILFIQSEKKRDADLLIKSFAREHQPQQIFIDAPLSIPKAFYGKGDDFFYREADRATKAMSPMFLGGLTARAVKLKYELSMDDIEFFESYPAGLANLLELKEMGYKKERYPKMELITKITDLFGLELHDIPANWHQFDALLAWLIGWRYKNNKANVFGDVDEGLMYY